MNQYYQYAYRARNSKWLLFVITLLFIWGCSDIDYSNHSGDGTVNLTLQIATTRSGDTVADSDIYNLRLIAFEMDEAGTSVVKVHNWMLYDSSDTPLSAALELGLVPQKYTMYFIANAKRSTSPGITNGDTFAGITTEEQLKQLLMNYGSQLPVYPYVMICKTTENFSNLSGNISRTFELNYTCVKVSYTINFDNNDTNISELLRGKQFELRGIQLKNLANQSYLINDNAENVIDTNTIFDSSIQTEFKDSNNDDIDFTGATWSYSGTAYLPEQIYDDPGADPISCMIITAGIVGSTINSTYKVNLTGKKDVAGYKHTPRATEYTFTGQILTPGDRDGLEYTLNIAGWIPQIIDTELGGNYTLQVSKTRANVGSLASDEISYETTAPFLTYESVKVTVGMDEKDLFIITEDPADKKIIIKLNPEIKAGTDLTGVDTYIYVVAGKLKKRIDIDCDLTPMLRVTPPKYTVNFKNQTEWERAFKYVTNLDNITVTKRDDVNTIITYDDALIAGSEQDLVCTIDETKEGLLNNRSHTVYLDFVATSNVIGIGPLKETVEIVLVPDNPLYRLHFRPIDDSWTNAHIYVYEPLYTLGGLEVFLSDASGVAGENAIRYSWSGNRSYKFELSNSTSGYGVGNSSYYKNEDHNPGWASVCQCSNCKSALNSYNSSSNVLNYKWPGIGMAVDTENPGWFYYDIPAGASPGITLIMFANAHSGQGENMTKYQRYPMHLKPGMTLYNYEDRDGWFLYDPDSELHEFVDNKPGLSVNATYRIWVKTSYATPYIYMWNGSKNSGRLQLSYSTTKGKWYYDLTPVMMNTLGLTEGWTTLNYIFTTSGTADPWPNHSGTRKILCTAWNNNEATVSY